MKFLGSLSMRPADSEPPDLYDDPRYERLPWEPVRAADEGDEAQP